MAILLLVPHHRRYTRRSEMKAIIAAVISIAFLMGAPSVRAIQADTEQEAGVLKTLRVGLVISGQLRMSVQMPLIQCRQVVRMHQEIT